MSIFEKIVTGKKVVFAPVYSMRSYETGEYNLEADGNFNRVMSVIRKYKPKTAYVLLPERSYLCDYTFMLMLQRIQGVEVVFVPSELYGVNAAMTRQSTATLPESIEEVKFDTLISEPQVFTQHYMKCERDFDLYYWCVATSTDKWPIWFVDRYKDTDRLIASVVPTIVATEAQKDALGGKAFVDDFYISEKQPKTIYFPFRLSDPDYEFESLELILNRLNARGYRTKFNVLVPDINDSMSRLDTAINSLVTKVPADHAVYNAIISGKPIVPYFEHMDRLPHISIYEMIDAGCKIITWDCEDARKYDTITTVTSYAGFEDAIAEMLEED